MPPIPAAVFAACAMLVTAGCAPFGVGAMPPIIGAARDGDTTRLEQLLRDGADPDVHAGVNNWTPLMHAIHKNQPGSVRVLLAAKARVNERGNNGMTALIMAAGYGYAGMVDTLLKAGAEPNAKMDNGTTALAAAVGGMSDIDRFTVGRCQTETVRTLLAGAPSLTRSGDPGAASALRIARLGGCSEVAQLVAALK